MARFIGRRKELRYLRDLLGKRSASFVVVRGRRRIGKSRLIEEFGQDMSCHIFAGLPPTPETTRQSQLDQFASQMSAAFDLPRFTMDSWQDLFRELAKRCAQGRVIVALDEISWLGSKSSDFLGQLKNAWDLHLSKNPELILIVCGSVSSWIEENILKHTGFLGRISVDLQLEELPIRDAARFWNGYENGISSHEILQVLAVIGGVPRYLEEVKPEQSAEWNIRRLCFDRGGLLYREFDQIFSDLFSSRAPYYLKIVELLADGALTFQQIADLVDKSASAVSGYLRNLVQARFISEDPAWNLGSTKNTQLKKYRLSDNYVRFYLKYIAPNRAGIEQNALAQTPLTLLPDWGTVMGLQFENLVLNNVHPLLEELQVLPANIVRYGPFFQRQTKRRRGCQIDLLIETRNRTAILCEIKFSAQRVGMEAVHQMRTASERIDLPRGWSKRHVLVHVNGVTDEVMGAGCFDHVVDFLRLLG